MHPNLLFRAAVSVAAAVAAAPAMSQSAPSRGELLYTTHCVTCHTTQMHWRDARRVRDWTTLRAEIERWQGEARLQWTSSDIDAVAQYLNDTIYKLPRGVASR